MRRGLLIAGGALTPVLFAVFPALSLFQQNETDVQISVLWPPLVFTAIGTLLAFAVIAAVSRSTASGGVLATLLVVTFFFYGIWFDGKSRWWLLPWLVVAVALGLAAVLLRRHLAYVLVILGVMGAVLAIPNIVRVASYQSNHPAVSARDSRLWPDVLTPPTGATQKPDIFVIVPDDYARSDVLAQYFHYDNSPFLQALRQRGFAVADQSRSPYSDSESNIAALLNMDYLTKFPVVLGKDSQDVRPVKKVEADNRAARLLASIGYRYVHLDTDEVTFGGSNPDISAFAPPDSFGNLWMSKSILGALGGPFGFDRASKNDRFRTSIRAVFGELGKVRTGSPPKFVVFHTLLPHDPYVYGDHGQAVNYVGTTDASLSSASGRSYYLHQLQYLNTLLLRTIDQIRAHATTPPVILIQSDEGFQAEPDVFGEKVMEDIRVKGLTALSLPGGPAGLPNPPNSVNDLRYVFNQVFATSYPLLPTHSYAEGDLPYDYSNPVNPK